ncbi:MAG: winged helix-turn-helix domain-containing protein [Pseudomonadota bacterium]
MTASKVEIVISDNRFIFDAISDSAKDSNIELHLVQSLQDLDLVMVKHPKFDLCILDVDYDITWASYIQKVYHRSKHIIDFTNNAIRKPFRLQSILKTIHAKHRSPELFCFIQKDLLYNESASALYLNGEVIKLTDKENQLICSLLKSDNHSVTKEHLLSMVWKYNESVETSAIETYLARLKKKLPEGLLVSRAGSVYLLYEPQF